MASPDSKIDFCPECGAFAALELHRGWHVAQALWMAQIDQRLATGQVDDDGKEIPILELPDRNRLMAEARSRGWTICGTTPFLDGVSTLTWGRRTARLMAYFSDVAGLSRVDYWPSKELRARGLLKEYREIGSGAGQLFSESIEKEARYGQPA